jgi:hypothetical protein
MEISRKLLLLRGPVVDHDPSTPAPLDRIALLPTNCLFAGGKHPDRLTSDYQA